MRKLTALIPIAVLFVLALLALQAGRPSAAQQAQAPVERWEYETELYGPGEFRATHLNAMGKQGWEFVQAVPTEKQPTILVFKRPRR